MPEWGGEPNRLPDSRIWRGHQKEMIELMILQDRISGRSKTEADYQLKRFEASEQQTIAAKQRYEVENLRAETLAKELAELRAQIANQSSKNNGQN